MRGLKPSLTIYSLLASHPSDVAYLPFGTSKVSWLEFIALSVPSQNLVLPFQWFSQWASSYSGGTAQDFHLLPYSPLPAAPAASYSVFKFVLTILYHIREFTQ